jgi:CTP:molybdopterin cytidylyltransferase MocA
MLRGRPVFDWAVGAMVDAGFEHAAVVTGGGAVPPLPPGVARLDNPGWASGIATSLAVAVRWAAEHGVDALVVGLGDQPFVTADSWQRVAAASDPIVVATYDGERGHPVRLATTVWPLLPTTGDFGARAVMAARPELVAEVPCDGSPADIDSVEDLHRWS